MLEKAWWQVRFKILDMGAKEYEPLMDRGAGFITASVVYWVTTAIMPPASNP